MCKLINSLSPFNNLQQKQNASYILTADILLWRGRGFTCELCGAKVERGEGGYIVYGEMDGEPFPPPSSFRVPGALHLSGLHARDLLNVQIFW